MVDLMDAPRRVNRAALRIRTQMQRYDLRVADLARTMGTSPARIETLISGRENIGPMLAAAIAPALRCTPAYLLTGEGTT